MVDPYYALDPTLDSSQYDVAPDQLRPTSVDPYASLPAPQEEPLPPEYVEEQFKPGGFDALLETLATTYGGRPHAAPRGFGQSFAASLLGSLSGQGARVAQARSKFQSAEDARKRLIDAERLKVQQENLRRRGEFGQQKTGGLIADINAGAAFARNEPVRKAAEQRQIKEDQRKAAADQRAQETLDRQNKIAQFQSVNQAQDNYRQDRAVLAYQQVRSNYITAKAASKLNSGPGDIALVFSFMRALEPDNINSVREGEYDNASKAVGLLQKYTNLPARFFNGKLLTDQGRQYFLTQMDASLKARRPDYDLANDQYRKGLAIVGADPSLVVRDFPPEPSLLLGTPAKGGKFKPATIDKETTDFLESAGF